MTEFSSQALRALDMLGSGLGVSSPLDLDAVRFTGTTPALDTPHRITAAGAASIAAVAACAARRWSQHRRSKQTITIDAVQATCALEPSHFQTQHGHRVPQSSHSRELKSGFYQTADNKWFMPSGSYPHLRDATLEMLDCPNTSAAIAAAISRRTGDELEQACAERAIPGVYARSREAWLRHPQGIALAHAPVITIEKVGESRPEVARPDRRPLDDLRVLDASHVVAGPVAARTLGAFGAQVLRISSPHQPDPIPQILDTGIGKRNAYLDLRDTADRDTLAKLARSTDVFVQSWRPSALDALGCSVADLARIRPGIIYVSINAFGFTGPWANRKGFDQMSQTATGIASGQGRGGKPALVPTRLLNDYLTAYLAAAGVMEALARRAIEGGSYHVQLSLARTSMWVQELGINEPAGPLQRFDDLSPVMQTSVSPFGKLGQLGPVAVLSETPMYWDQGSAPLGAHEAIWLDQPDVAPVIN